VKEGKGPKVKLKLGVTTWREAGEAAGRVYEHLALEGPKNFAELVRGLKTREGLILMALGWLSREDKVEFGEDGRVYLKEHSN